MWTAILFDEAVIRAVQETLPPIVVTLFAYLTMLGEVPVYVVVLLVYYYGIDRERGVSLLVIGLSVSTVTLGLKELFAFERPPDILHDPRAGAGSYAFPSGHTLSAFVIYGAVISAIDSLSRRQQLGIGALVIGAVSASRVVLGVHYPGDVLGAWVVGAAMLVLYLGVARLVPNRTVLVALALTVPLVLYHAALEELLFGFGGLIGVAAAWWLVGSDYRFDLRSLVGIGQTALGIGVVLGLVVGLEAVGAPTLPATIGVGFVAGAYPDLWRLGSARLEDWRAVEAVGGR